MKLGDRLSMLGGRLRGLTLPVLHRLAAPNGVVLTIDDGPMPGATPGILSALRRHGAKAVFFVNGRRAAARPDLVAEILADGHQVFSHGFAHIRFDRLGPIEIAQDMERAEEVLGRLRPAPSPYPVRLPYGEGWKCRSVHRSLAAWRKDCVIVHWTRHAEDWAIAGRCRSADDVDPHCAAAAARLTDPNGLPGAILLLHDHPVDAVAGLNDEVAVAFVEHVLRALDQRGIAPKLLDLAGLARRRRD